ncbi:hypothetical protein Tco_0177589 [Tanacetum coccineum]
MYRVVQKMKILKNPLKKLNWKNGNMFEKFKGLKQKLNDVQNKLDPDPFNVDLNFSSVQLVNEYIVAAKDEFKLIHQKATINWLKEGDRNSANFHSILRTRKNKSRIETISKEFGSRVEGVQVPEQIVNHFKNFLGKSQPMQPLNDVGNFMQARLSEEDTLAMITMVTDDEIKATLYDIDSSKSDGLDEYTLCFF